MNLNELTIAIEEWAAERKLHATSQIENQISSITRRIDYLYGSVIADDDDLIKESIGYAAINLIILSNQMGVSLAEPIRIAFEDMKEEEQ